MEYRKIEKPNLVNEVYTQLKKQILSGSLAEGDKLFSENKLCEEFNVSRVVIREAMQILRANRLIVTRQGKGSFVANPENFIDADEKGNFLNSGARGEFDERSLSEYFEFRKCLDYKALELAVKRGAQKDFKKIKSALDNMKRCIGDVTRFSEADYEFHFAIAQASDNRFIIQSYRSCKSYIVNCFEGMNSINDSHQWGLDTHQKLYDMIVARDWKGAVALLSQNDDYNLARISSMIR